MVGAAVSEKTLESLLMETVISLARKGIDLSCQFSLLTLQVHDNQRKYYAKYFQESSPSIYCQDYFNYCWCFMKKVLIE